MEFSLLYCFPYLRNMMKDTGSVYISINMMKDTQAVHQYDCLLCINLFLYTVQSLHHIWESHLELNALPDLLQIHFQLVNNIIFLTLTFSLVSASECDHQSHSSAW